MLHAPRQVSMRMTERTEMMRGTPAGPMLFLLLAWIGVVMMMMMMMMMWRRMG